MREVDEPFHNRFPKKVMMPRKVFRGARTSAALDIPYTIIISKKKKKVKGLTKFLCKNINEFKLIRFLNNLNLGA